MLPLSYKDYCVKVTNEPDYDPRSADNVKSYTHRYLLDETTEYRTSSQHGIAVSRHNDEIASCLLLAGGGSTGVHDHSALIHDNSCFIAIGPFMASVSLPSLELEWATEADSCTCFGVHFSEKHQCLISHGELTVARVSFDGEIMWSNGGADILTNGFTLFDDYLEVIDFEDQKYRLDLETGCHLSG